METDSAFQNSFLCSNCEALTIVARFEDDIHNENINISQVGTSPSGVINSAELNDQSPDFPYLTTSASSGCQFCAVLLQSLAKIECGNNMVIVCELRYIKDKDPDIAGFTPTTADTYPRGIVALSARVLLVDRRYHLIWNSRQTSSVPALATTVYFTVSSTNGQFLHKSFA